MDHFDLKGSRRDENRDSTWVWRVNKAHCVAQLICFSASLLATFGCFPSSNWPLLLSFWCTCASFASPLRIKACVCVWKTAGSMCTTSFPLAHSVRLERALPAELLFIPSVLEVYATPLGALTSFFASRGLLERNLCNGYNIWARCRLFGNKWTLDRNIIAILFSFHFFIILLVRPIQEGPDKCAAQWTAWWRGPLGAWMFLAWVMLHRVLALFVAVSHLAAATAGL